MGIYMKGCVYAKVYNILFLSCDSHVIDLVLFILSCDSHVIDLVLFIL